MSLMFKRYDKTREERLNNIEKIIHFMIEGTKLKNKWPNKAVSQI